MPTLPVAIDAREMKKGAAVVSTSMKKIRGSSKLTRDELGRFQKKTRSVGGTLKGVGSKLIGFFGAFSAAIAIRSAVKTIGDFEESIVTLGQVVGATQQELENLEITARKLGATTRFSATEASEGLLFLARAGFTTNESMAALPATLNLAQAGVLSLGEAADLASNVLRQFGLNAEDTVRIVDDLINVSNKSNTNVRQLGEALKFAGVVAKQSGQSLEETTAQLGLLGDAGIQAGQAGTNLRGVILALASPSDAASKAFNKIGLDLEEMKKQGLSTSQILEKLAENTDDVGIAAQIFGRRNAAAAIIIGKFQKRMQELIEIQKAGKGAAEAQAKAMDDTLNGAIKNLVSAFQELQLTVGDTGAAGAFRRFIEGVTDGLKVLIGLEKNLKGSASRAFAFAAGMKLVVIALVSLVAIKAGITIAALAVSMNTLANTSARAAIALSPLVSIFAILGVAAAALSFGKFLGNEFRIAAEFANGFATGFFKLVENLRFAWEAGILALKFAWQNFTFNLTKLFVSALELIATAYDGFIKTFPKAAKVLGIEEAGTAFKAIAAGVSAGNKNVAFATLEEIKNLVKESEAEIKKIEQAGVVGLKMIEKQFKGKSRKGNTFASAILEDMKLVNEQIAMMNLGVDLTSKASLDVQVNYADINAEMEEFNRQLNDALNAQKKITEEQKLMKSAVNTISNTLTDGIVSALTSAKSLREVLNDTGRQISQQIARQAISSAISQGLNSAIAAGSAGGGAGAGAGGNVGGGGGITSGVPVGSALGNVFANGNLVPMANGGIVSGPTTFPLSNGNTGLMGEAGPEAVLPLKRNSRGQLGVVSAGDGRGKTVNIVQNFNITTPNPDSFMSSRTQILADAKAGLANT